MISVSINETDFHLGYHYELINYPPKEVTYRIETSNKVIPAEAVFNGSNNKRRLIRHAQSIKSYDYIPYFSDSAQLIHSASWPVINNVPHVIDMDMFFYPYLVGMAEFERIKKLEAGWPLPGKLTSKIKSRLKVTEKLLKSKFCKKILPWSKWCRDYIMDFLDDSEIIDKIEVLYPAVHHVNCKKETGDKVRLVYNGASGWFVRKGGIEILRIFEELRQDYKNIELAYVGNMPRNLPYIYNKYARCNDIKFYSFLPKPDLFELYRRSDIFVLPTRHDTFAISLLEAMSYKLPVVTTKGKFVPVSEEIVDDKVSGFLIELKGAQEPGNLTGLLNLKDFTQKLRLLIESKSLRKKMGEAGMEKIVNGKFSLKKRNKRLEEIYKEALQ